MESLLNLADEIAETEVNLTKLNPLEANLPPPKSAPHMQRELRWHIAEVRNFRAVLRKREETIGAELQKIIVRRGDFK